MAPRQNLWVNSCRLACCRCVLFRGMAGQKAVFEWGNRWAVAWGFDQQRFLLVSWRGLVKRSWALLASNPAKDSQVRVGSNAPLGRGGVRCRGQLFRPRKQPMLFILPCLENVGWIRPSHTRPTHSFRRRAKKMTSYEKTWCVENTHQLKEVRFDDAGKQVFLSAQLVDSLERMNRDMAKEVESL